MDAKEAALVERQLKIDRLKVEKQARGEVADLPRDEFYEGIEDLDDRIPPEHFQQRGIIYIDENGEIVENLLASNEADPADVSKVFGIQIDKDQKVVRPRRN
eukprot:TRINITY_DN770_c0_g1_i2.p1 TRINITY_DN770_c0_g1~~TRINITY_DN770_c0_g1_i2.p1  ORF type:complete len:102 (-),score=22.23 TRINITY_DN770_c0_g1_i2:76-381(-)